MSAAIANHAAGWGKHHGNVPAARADHARRNSHHAIACTGRILPLIAQKWSTEMRTMIFASVLLPAACIDVLGYATAFSQPVVSVQDAGITATSNVITAAHVPVLATTGKTSFFDVSINLTPVLEGATVKGLKASTKSSSMSPNYITKGFMPGTYMDSFGSTYTVGGGATLDNQTVWSVSNTNCAYNSCLISATWDTDDGANNPEYPLLQKYKITTTTPAFGASGGIQGGDYPADFSTGFLIGAIASGSTITICSWEDANGKIHTSEQACLTLFFQHS